MEYIKTNNELYHHGVIGMKWGVRRYQNEDGSYTKKGLERYNKSREDYQSAKEAHKTSKTKTTSDAKRAAKKKLTESKKDLRRSVKVDRGRDIYREGYDTYDVRRNARVAHIAVGVASSIGISIVRSQAQSSVSAIKATQAILIGEASAHAAISVLKHKTLSDMRAYRNRKPMS